MTTTIQTRLIDRLLVPLLILVTAVAALGVGSVLDAPDEAMLGGLGLLGVGVMAGFPFPYDIENILGGAVRVLMADPAVTAIPAGVHSVMSMVSPYAALTGWTDLGATRDAFTYTRGFDTEGLEIQQVSGSILEELTDISRTIEVSVAEFNTLGFQLMENASGETSIAAASGRSAQKQIKFGSFASLKRYRFAFISQRSSGARLVTEPGGATRGAFVMGVGYQCQLTADEIELEQDKGALTAVGISFSMFPDSTVALAADSWGSWFTENAGTIAA